MVCTQAGEIKDSNGVQISSSLETLQTCAEPIMLLPPFTNVRPFSYFDIDYIHTKMSEHTY